METGTASEATSRLARVVVPVALGIVFLGVWEFLVHWLGVPKFVLPPPSLIFESLLTDYGTLAASMWKTLEVTIAAFFVALVLGVSGAILFTQSRLFEISLFPYAVVLQVTPIVSIAPFILIWVGLDHTERALLILATIVAFFRILSNTTLGMKSVDHNLLNLFDLYRASRWQRLRYLQLPSAMPYLLGGMKISGGLARSERSSPNLLLVREPAPDWLGASSNPRTGSTFPACSRHSCFCRRSASPFSLACRR
jgi:NitT/TauT family transport system permease protein